MLKRRSVEKALTEPAVHKWDSRARALFVNEVTRSRRFDRTVGLVVVDLDAGFTAVGMGALVDAVRRYDVIVADPRGQRVAIIVPEAGADDVDALALRVVAALAGVNLHCRARIAIAPDDGVDLDTLAASATATAESRRAWPKVVGE